MAITTLSTKFKNAYDPFWLHSVPIWRRPVIRFVQTARALFFRTPKFPFFLFAGSNYPFHA